MTGEPSTRRSASLLPARLLVIATIMPWLAGCGLLAPRERVVYRTVEASCPKPVEIPLRALPLPMQPGEIERELIEILRGERPRSSSGSVP